MSRSCDQSGLWVVPVCAVIGQPWRRQSSNIQRAAVKLSLKKSEAVLCSLSELFVRKSSSLIDFLPLLLHLNDDVTLFTVPVLDFGRRPRRTSVVCETFSIMRLKGLTGSLYQPQIIRHVCLSRKSQTNQRNEGFSPLSLTCSVTELWCKNTCLNPTRWSLQVTVENALLLWNYITQQPLYSRVLISWAVCCDLVCDWSHECESDFIMINMVQFSLWCFSFMYMSVMTL